MELFEAVRLWNQMANRTIGIIGEGEQSEEVTEITAFGGFAIGRGAIAGLDISPYRKERREDAAMVLEELAKALRQ
jgi:hypothetical protein